MQEVVASAESFFRNWREADPTYDVKTSPTNRTQIPASKWQAPSTGQMKTNVDVAIFREQNKSGVGIIARYRNGTCLACESLPFWHSDKIPLLEACAIVEG